MTTRGGNLRKHSILINTRKRGKSAVVFGESKFLVYSASGGGGDDGRESEEYSKDVATDNRRQFVAVKK